MKTATVRDLRNHFAAISTWIGQGESVSITKAGKPFAVLGPAVQAKEGPVRWPDFQARRKGIASETGNGTPLSRILLDERGDR